MRRTCPTLVLAATLLAAGCAGDAPARFLTLGTAGTGGIYYPLGGALASRLSVADSSRRFTAEVTGGSLENVNRIRSGEMDVGLAVATTVHEAYTGGRDFDGAYRDLRIVAPLYPNVTHVLVADGSGVGSVGDLAGRRVSVGSPGSGTEQVARQVLAAYGLGYDAVDEEFLSFTESSAALRDRAIDAAIFSVGYPASAVLEATTGADARLVGIDEEHRGILRARHPYYSAGTIPAGSYPGQDEAVPTVAVMNWIVVDESLDAGVVRGILRVLSEERDELVRVHGIARQIDLGAVESAPIPLHPATRRWREGR